MALKDALKVSRKTFFNPRAWIGYDSLKNQNQTIWSFVTDLTQRPEPEYEESFAEAMERLGVSEGEVRGIQRTYLSYALFFVAIAIADLIYSIYLLFYHGSFFGFVLGLAVGVMMLGQAFKFHFWYFQIKNRKLGCTLEEWKSGKINPVEPKSKEGGEA